MAYIVRRCLSLVLVLFGVSLVVFLMMALLPGDAATAILGPFATPERVAVLNQELGLTGSLPERYLVWLWNLLHGDLGRSYSLGDPVMDLVQRRFWRTALLASFALGLGTLVGLLLGSVAAACRGRWPDRLLTMISLIGISTPAFWLAMLLMLVFSVKLGWFPVSGMRTVHILGEASIWDVGAHLVLPSVALGSVVAGVIARLTRTQMLETLPLDFVRLARAKGVDEGRVIYGHAFLVAFSQVVPVIGLQAGFVLGGAVYIETVFQWPGLGKLLVDAILQRDVLLAQGTILVLASLYVLVNLLTDLLQYALDPRLRA